MDNFDYYLNVDNSNKFCTHEPPYDFTIIEIKDNKYLNFWEIDYRVFEENPNEMFKEKYAYLIHYPNTIFPDFSMKKILLFIICALLIMDLLEHQH